MDEKDFQEHFLRQRRNLMGFSIFVLAINVSGAKLDKINLLGNEVVIYRHGLLMFMLSLAVAYFLVRYFQYFLHLKRPVSRYISPYYRGLLARYVVSREFKASEEFRAKWGGMKKIMFDPASIYSNGRVSVGIVGRGGGSLDQHYFESPKRIVLGSLYVAGALAASIRTPVFTEYILPVLLAVLGLVSFAFRAASPYVCIT